MTARVDCIEEYTFPEPGKCVPVYRPRVFSKYYTRMVELSGDHVLQGSPRAAWEYAHNWITGALEP